MRPSKFQVGDRVKDKTIAEAIGWIESVRWDGNDYVYAIHLDDPIIDSVLRDKWIAREIELERQLTYPVLHINGTSKEELMRQLTEAHHQILKTLEAVHAAAPHSRDYYPSGEFAWLRARLEWEQRIASLERVRDEVFDIALTVDAMGEKP